MTGSGAASGGRTSPSLLLSVTYRIHIATIAKDATAAVAPCPILPDENFDRHGIVGRIIGKQRVRNSAARRLTTESQFSEMPTCRPGAKRVCIPTGSVRLAYRISRGVARRSKRLAGRAVKDRDAQFETYRVREG